MASKNISKPVSDSLELAVHMENKLKETDDQADGLEELRDALIKQANFYKEENAKMEAVLKKLQLLGQELTCQSQVELDKLVKLQEQCSSGQCRLEALGLSLADRMRKRNNYRSKVKFCIKIYANLMERLNKEIKVAKGEYERTQKKITSFSTVSQTDIKALAAKAERYEKELSKFEKKYPWLKDSQYHLQSMSKDAETLETLRKEKEKLWKELQTYQDLKPDINEALKQLACVKQEYHSLK